MESANDMIVWVIKHSDKNKILFIPFTKVYNYE